MSTKLDDLFSQQLALCIRNNDPYRYNDVILGRKPMVKAQRQIIDTFLSHRITIVATANGMGKSYAASTLTPFLLHTHSSANPCKVIITAPTDKVIREVYWQNLQLAYEKSPFNLPGRMLQSPTKKIQLSPEHFLVCFSAVDTENASGYHSPNLYAIIDEASNVSPAIYDAIMSWNPKKVLLLGNPLRNDGFFYELAQKALAQGNNSDMAFLQISAMDSPYIDVEDSKSGLADKTWLNMIRNVYGEDSLYWKTHVLAQFAESNTDCLIPADWLNNNIAEKHEKKGQTTMAIDLSEGVGRDNSIILVRDENGICDVRKYNKWGLAETAKQAAEMAVKYNVIHSRIIYDKTGLGADFDNRLRAVGIYGARPYKGALEVSQKAAAKNLRSQAGWNLRRRLHPEHKDLSGPVPITQPKFYIKPEYLLELRPEINACSYSQVANGKVQLTPKENIAKMIGHSPDLLDALMMSFAFWMK